MDTAKRRRLFRLLAVIATVLIAVPLVLADNLQADGDAVATGVNPLDFGNVCAGETYTKNALVFVKRVGQGNVFQNLASVTVSRQAGLGATGGSISLPSDWVDKPNNTESDKLASVVTLVPSGAPGTYTGSVAYQATGTDTGGKTLTLNATLSVHWTIVDCAPSDTTPPVITPNVSGTLGNNGWYVSDVTVSWTVSDPESTITSSGGCGTTTINYDTAGETLTCWATSAGGTSSQSVTIKRDVTPPTISGAPDRAANGNGWYNADVTVSWTCGDNLSGVASCSGPETLGEGANQSATGTATDLAGNSASATISGINVDKTAPTIVGSRTPGPNAYGWNNTDVAVSFTCNDSLSGVASCLGATTLTGEGAGQSVTGTAVDKAGNSATATVGDINIDKTAPVVTFGTPSPAANAAGWNNTNVSISFTAEDSLSGVMSSVPASSPLVLTAEGSAVSGDVTATDAAGNSATYTSPSVKIDKTAPTFGACPAGGPFLLSSGLQSVGPISATDTLSGLDGDASTLTGSVDTSSVGPKTVTFTAFDNAGNTATKSCTYQVIYDWHGFFRPVDNPPILNVAKAGSAIPVKFSLSGDQGLNIFAAGYPKSGLIACDAAAIPDTVDETVTAGGSSLSYDALADQYVYVWKTDKAWAGTCRQLQVKLIDGTMHLANFKFK